MRKSECVSPCFFIVLALLVAPLSAYAGKVIAMGNPGEISSTGTLQVCFERAAKYYRIPVGILRAIARTESDMKPYALNINGKSFTPESLSEAVKLLLAHKNDNPDIGLMQINAFWFRKYGYPLYFGLEPCFSIYFGAYILRRKINRYGFNWFGIAAYHSVNPAKNRRYARLIYENLAKEEVQ